MAGQHYQCVPYKKMLHILSLMNICDGSMYISLYCKKFVEALKLSCKQIFKGCLFMHYFYYVIVYVILVFITFVYMIIHKCDEMIVASP